jgi:hypothetical protein
MTPIHCIAIGYIAGLATGVGFWAYALFQQPKERADGGPYPIVDLPEAEWPEPKGPRA